MMHPSLAKQKPLVDFDKKSELVIKKIYFFFGRPDPQIWCLR